MANVERSSAMNNGEALFVIRDGVTGTARAMFGASVRQARDGINSIFASCNRWETVAQRHVAQQYLRQYADK